MHTIKNIGLILLLVISLYIIILKNQTIDISYNNCDQYYYDKNILNLAYSKSAQLNRTWITTDHHVLDNLVLVPGLDYTVDDNGISIITKNGSQQVEIDTSTLTYDPDTIYTSNMFVNLNNNQLEEYSSHQIIGALTICKEGNDD